MLGLRLTNCVSLPCVSTLNDGVNVQSLLGLMRFAIKLIRALILLFNLYKPFPSPRKNGNQQSLHLIGLLLLYPSFPPRQTKQRRQRQRPDHPHGDNNLAKGAGQPEGDLPKLC